MIIKRVGPVSIAKIAGVIYAALGLVGGVCLFLFGLFGIAAQRGVADNPVSPFFGVGLGVGAIVLGPIVYGAIGFVFTLIGAWLYNLVASKIGGIEVDVA